MIIPAYRTVLVRLGRVVHGCAYAAALATTALVWLTLGFELWVRCTSTSPALLDHYAGSVRIHDRHGTLLREAVSRDGMRATWQPLERISPLVIDATIAVEDARFYDHRGIDSIGVARALYDNVRAREVVSGASTLTMQLARLIEPSAKHLFGKLAEMARARRLERWLTKRGILEQYLNRAPYGAGTVGIEAASQRYFGKESAHLSLAEAALLAGLPKAPSRYNPLRYPALAKARQRKVLARMLETGAISREEHDRTIAEPLDFAGKPQRLAAMHFTEMVLSALPLDQRLGDVRTSLDLPLQEDVAAAVHAHVSALATSGVGDATALVIDNATCEIRALAGSKDYFDDQSGAVNGALAPRQPGSTLKPFTYALAFEQGYTPASVVADIETSYGGEDGPIFRPQNFSGRFSGPVLMGDALGRSLNVPAIRVAELVGAGALLDRLRALGMKSLNRSAAYYGLGLTLGNGEVTLLELGQAYAALARGGIACTATPLPTSGPVAGERVFSSEVSYLITDVLSDEGLRIAAFGPANALLLDFPVAVKTGTSSNWRDSWAVGYTDRFTVAVWSGNFDGSSMNHIAGATGAGPLFHTIMTLTVSRDLAARPGAAPPSSPRPPPGIVATEVCALSGHLPSQHCPHRRPVHVPADQVPAETCAWHQPIAMDKRTDLRAGEHCPAEHVIQRVFAVLPPEYASWQADSGLEAPPSAYSPLCPADGPIPGSVVITHPREGDVFLIEPGFDRATQTLRLRAQVDGMAAAVTWSVNGTVIAKAPWPYEARFRLVPGRHTLKASAPGQQSDEINIEVR